MLGLHSPLFSRATFCGSKSRGCFSRAVRYVRFPQSEPVKKSSRLSIVFTNGSVHTSYSAVTFRRMIVLFSTCPQTPIILYDYDNSSTAGLLPCSDRRCKHCSDESNHCEYSIPYMGGEEATGYFVSDEFSLDMIPVHSQVAHGSSTRIIFGCSTTVSGLLAKAKLSLNGILGLSQGPLSVVSQLSSQGITPNVFSHCLKGDGDGGGILVLGEILEPSIVYTPLVPK
ncbi:unnamed protein product [Malus baccata var. baccata]